MGGGGGGEGDVLGVEVQGKESLGVGGEGLRD